ncbi:PaaI family thioesterase [Pseudomonas sp. C11]|uniref:PaaI family thioesterase n=1 Tax=Pseudomonas sp. C11 TaxID=3075550 RepID=UPI002B00117F|nr:PaaI family thioesterase [Pseudomonas sp. C11]
MSKDGLPGFMGIKVCVLQEKYLEGQLIIEQKHLQDGYLHTGSVTTLADTICGYATLTHLPPEAHTFTPFELNSHYLKKSTTSSILCIVEAVQLRKEIYTWDATIYEESAEEDTFGQKLALFRCTHLIRRLS